MYNCSRDIFTRGVHEVDLLQSEDFMVAATNFSVTTDDPDDLDISLIKIRKIFYKNMQINRIFFNIVLVCFKQQRIFYKKLQRDINTHTRICENYR